MSQIDDDGYEVGYKRPPLHSRFQKGHSQGNRAGRKKGSRNLKSDLLDEMAERITVNEGDRSIRISKQRALIKSLILRGIKGNDRAAARALELVAKLTLPDDEPDARTPLEEADRAIIEQFFAQGGSDGDA